LKDDKNGHQKIVDAFVFLIAREWSMAVSFEELDESQQIMGQRYRSKKNSSESDCQSPMTLVLKNKKHLITN